MNFCHLNAIFITVNWWFHSSQSGIHYGQILTVRSTYFTPWFLVRFEADVIINSSYHHHIFWIVHFLHAKLGLDVCSYVKSLHISMNINHSGCKLALSCHHSHILSKSSCTYAPPPFFRPNPFIHTRTLQMPKLNHLNLPRLTTSATSECPKDCKIHIALSILTATLKTLETSSFRKTFTILRLYKDSY